MTDYEVVDLGGMEVTETTPVVAGPRGRSAYEVAVANGFVGTEAEWLASLKGDPGDGGTGGGAVDSVNGEVGVVVLDAADVGAETPTGAQTKVDTHAADTTSVHGIPDTSLLATTADVSAASTADRARANHTGTQTSATISDFTEAVQDAVAALLASGSNVTLTYDDAANSLTVTAATGGDAEVMRDTIGAALVGVGNVAVTVNDAADTITISTTATVNSTDAALRDRSTHTGTQTMSTISDAGTAATKNTGTGSTNVILGNDARLSDARTPVARSTNTQTGTAYTLVLTDAYANVDLNNAAAVTLTVPPNSSVALPVGTVIPLAQLGAGQVTITAGAGVTVNATPGLKIAARYGVAELRKTATDTWLAYGRLSA